MILTQSGFRSQLKFSIQLAKAILRIIAGLDVSFIRPKLH